MGYKEGFKLELECEYIGYSSSRFGNKYMLVIEESARAGNLIIHTKYKSDFPTMRYYRLEEFLIEWKF